MKTYFHRSAVNYFLSKSTLRITQMGKGEQTPSATPVAKAKFLFTIDRSDYTCTFHPRVKCSVKKKALKQF